MEYKARFLCLSNFAFGNLYLLLVTYTWANVPQVESLLPFPNVT